ncbi:MAG: hypothetical protein Fur0025_45460 [Oscillatoriaceae cyanobacterium]
MSKSFRDAYITNQTIADNLQEALKVVLDDVIVVLDPNNIPISGNLNAEKIKSIIEEYGFYGNLGVPEKEINRILDDVVKLRCDLAHGNVSFSDASSGRTWGELQNSKEKIVKYLNYMLGNIETYIDNQRYKK